MTETPVGHGREGGAGRDRAPRRTVASFRSYAEVAGAVDYLSDRGFAVDRVAIVADDVRLVEHVTGRAGYGDAAWRGAFVGGIVGLVWAWLVAVLNWSQPVMATGWLTLWGLIVGLVIGAVIGALIAAALHAATRGDRDFDSVRGFEADRYDLVVDGDVAAEAERLLVDRSGAGRAGIGGADQPGADS